MDAAYLRVVGVAVGGRVSVPDLHFGKKDFRIEWFSGTGAGGQYRNKHQNCCRITHIATGLRAQGTSARERPTNQRDAFTKLAKLLIAHYSQPEEGRRDTSEVIRNYHAERNEVLDKASRFRQTYKEVVIDGNLDRMIEARRVAKGS
jgi:protein subunit release factor A